MARILKSFYWPSNVRKRNWDWYEKRQTLQRRRLQDVMGCQCILGQKTMTAENPSWKLEDSESLDKKAPRGTQCHHFLRRDLQSVAVLCCLSLPPRQVGLSTWLLRIIRIIFSLCRWRFANTFPPSFSCLKGQCTWQYKGHPCAGWRLFKALWKTAEIPS